MNVTNVERAVSDAKVFCEAMRARIECILASSTKLGLESLLVLCSWDSPGVDTRKSRLSTVTQQCQVLPASTTEEDGDHILCPLRKIISMPLMKRFLKEATVCVSLHEAFASANKIAADVSSCLLTLEQAHKACIAACGAVSSDSFDMNAFVSVGESMVSNMKALKSLILKMPSDTASRHAPLVREASTEFQNAQGKLQLIANTAAV